MDDVVVARVNDTLDGIRRQVAALEHRSQAMQEGCAEKRLAVENWSNTQVALDDEHNTQYIRKAAAREGAFVGRQEGRLWCAFCLRF